MLTTDKRNLILGSMPICHGDLHQQEPNLTFRYKTDHLASATVPDLQIRMKKQINDP